MTTSPLFVTVKTEEFKVPDRIAFHCSGECKATTDWFLVYSETPLGSGASRGTPPDETIKSVAYHCFRCRKMTLTVVYREIGKEERPVATVPSSFSRGFKVPTIPVLTDVMKVGQFPAPRIVIPQKLEKNLGEDAVELYRKAMICRNSGFGLAAVGYMRRIVEDKTNELIEVAAAFAEAHHVKSETVAKMRKAIDADKYTPYETKLKIAGSVFPKNLRVGDVNPLDLLFRYVSKGLHGLSELECIAIADEIRTVFTYVFENLQAEISDRRRFVDTVNKLSKSK
ncbi:hypothetical protein [Terriglobus albidus]|uniref:hypothetical protein n=1 Tax=Terriglobus albidus TaxID=1592106 RepID=UPI0021E0248E|nr:hypothetical protein [Terriglobus albidus]